MFLSLALRVTTLIVIAYGWSSLPGLQLTQYLEQMTGGRFKSIACCAFLLSVFFSRSFLAHGSVLGKWQLLTLHGLALNVSCESVGLLQLLLPSIPAIQNLQHLLFLVSLPVEIIVSLVYVASLPTRSDPHQLRFKLILSYIWSCSVVASDSHSLLRLALCLLYHQAPTRISSRTTILAFLARLPPRTS
jgi:hypothetical protein